MAMIQSVSRNAHGRDFIVGDIHGAFDLVAYAMDLVSFNPQRDRLFSVGDLVDRGENSALALDFLRQPYFHAVRGNHEQHLLDLYAFGEPDDSTLQAKANQFGMEWWLRLSAEERANFLNALSELPVVIELQTARGMVGILHADVPREMDWETFCQRVDAGDKNVIETALEGRDRILDERHEGVAGVDRVFVGHTIQWDGVQRFGNVYAVDTGAIFGLMPDNHDGHLTMIPVTLGTRELSRRRPRFNRVDVREPGSRDDNKPFGVNVKTSRRK